LNNLALLTLQLEEGNKFLEIRNNNLPDILEDQFDKFLCLIKTNIDRKILLKKFRKFDYILDFYDYCEFLNFPFQQLSNLKNFSGIKLLLSLEEDSLTELIRTRIIAYRHEEAYKIFNQLLLERKMMAYSHRKCGWAAQPFTINKDLRVQFNTNFGYGSSSYFFLAITYNNIPIIPYSDWITYRYAPIEQILRYTRKYEPKDENWIVAMTDCKDAYNMLVKDEIQFIQYYVIEEATQMVAGLKDLMVKDEFHQLTNNREKIKIQYNGYHLTRYRAEKISGALKFISPLNKYIHIEKMKDCRDAIISLNKTIKPTLENELQQISNHLSEIRPMLKMLEPIVQELRIISNNKTETHNRIVREFQSRINSGIIASYSIEDVENQLDIELPNWRLDENKYFTVHNKQYIPLKNENNELGLIEKDLSLFLKDIESYFERI
jgi:hypothetical protein